MSDTVQEIKERLSITDVVAPYVKLTKAGKYYKGLCPFHNEKTPSFMVSPERGFYHCFGCGKGGDVFTFIQEMERVDFRGALTMLAEKAGVEITRERPEGRDRKEKLYAALQDAAEFFAATLAASDAPRAYLAARGVSDETVLGWGVGYAPSAWNDTLEYLAAHGHDEAIIEASGLAKRPDTENQESAAPSARLYDRFRGRIMFPIKDTAGRVIGFSGRLFPEDGTSKEQAKYINSPETALFDKSRTLYGLNVARSGIRKYDFAILVEGQFDLLMAHQAGYVNSVALSGTAFTEHHAKLVRRSTENLVLAFDADRAGIAASGRAAALALSEGLNVKVAALPPGEDPAELIRQSTEAWREAVKGAVHVVDFYLAYLKTLGYDERTFKLEVSHVVLPYVARVGNAIDRAHFVSRVAEAIRVPEAAVSEEVHKLMKGTPARAAPRRPGALSEENSTTRHEPFLSRGDTLERLLVGIMQSMEGNAEHAELHTTLEKRLGSLLGKERIEAIATSPDERRVSLIEGDLFLADHRQNGDLEVLLDELMADLKKELARVRYREATLKLAQAEKEGKKDDVKSLLKTLHLLAGEL